jgi:hypothetical protein
MRLSRSIVDADGTVEETVIEYRDRRYMVEASVLYASPNIASITYTFVNGRAVKWERAEES